MSEIIVSLVTGTYNRLNYLIQMVQSFRESIGIGIPYEIVLVDGGSTDGTIAWCKSQPDIVLIEQGKLYGAVKAFNAGFAAAQGIYVVIANDDIRFLYEGVRSGIAMLQDDPTVGVGCFAQNRHHKEFTVDIMPAIKDGYQTSLPYGQVCIVPKWLGDNVGWWGDKYHTYAGDNELTANIYELGYKVQEIPYACIEDYTAKDELRDINSQHITGTHPDSVLFYKKWTHLDGRIGPIVKNEPVVPNPIKRRPRVLYMPIYEKGNWLQIQTKTGLREALQKRCIVSEVSTLFSPEDVVYAALLFKPDIILTQVQHPTQMPMEFLLRMKGENPQAKLVNWNGDYNPSMLMSRHYQGIMKEYDLTTYVCADVLERYRLQGIKAAYWQIGFEKPLSVLPKLEPGYDVVFLGNCYHQWRRDLAMMLRDKKDLRVGIFGRGYPAGLSNGDNIYNFSAGDQLYRSAKIAISDCVFRKSVAYFSNRLLQILSSGAFCLHQRTVEMTEYTGLEDGKHLIFWDNLDDLAKKIDYWLPREEERSKIAAEGQKFTLKHHSFDARVDELFKMLGIEA